MDKPTSLQLKTPKARLEAGLFCAQALRVRQKMSARNYLVFGDIEGKLDVLLVECTKCPRKGRYRVAKLIEKYGRRANMIKWKALLNGDCPKRDGRLHDRCDLVCPDLPSTEDSMTDSSR